jgi:hypothetical protein
MNTTTNKNIFLLVVLALLACFPSDASAFYWQQVKAEHFIVNFTENKTFAQEVLNNAENNYNTIADRLGYQRFSDFWTWEKRVNIFVYPDHSSYTQATGQMEWADGKADYKNKEISMYAGDPKFLKRILPHEIAHLMFRDFIGIKTNIPLWIDEGVATSVAAPNADEIYADMKNEIKKLYDRSALLTLNDMMTLDFKRSSTQTTVHDVLMKDNSPGYLFLSSTNFLTVYYIEAASIISFLRDHYGVERFAEFCRELRDGKTVEAALANAYPEECPDIKKLEEKWRQSIAED